MKSTVNDLYPFFAAELKQNADYEIVLDRNESDRYFVSINPLTINSQFDSFTVEKLAETIVPAGSWWEPLMGWRSFFGEPFLDYKGNRGMVIGLAVVAPHNTRGAYACMLAYVFDGSQLNLLSELIIKIANKLPVKEKNTSFVSTFGIVSVESSSPYEHMVFEKALLCMSANELLTGNKMLFRTLALVETELPDFNNSKAQSLVIVNPVVIETYSPKMQRYVRLGKNKSVSKEYFERFAEWLKRIIYELRKAINTF